MLSRRNLIGGAWARSANPIRPPWSLPEAEFIGACTACGDCIEACPGSIIHRRRAGYPVVDFSRGACDFCGECAEVCGEGAFLPRERIPWRLVAIFGDDCLSSRGVTCRVCAEWCDAQAIGFTPIRGGHAKPALTITDCTGCGACVSVCPVQAVRLEKRE